jgi:hypothetical protein
MRLSNGFFLTQTDDVHHPYFLQDISIARLNTLLCTGFKVHEIEYIRHFICAALTVFNEENL